LYGATQNNRGTRPESDRVFDGGQNRIPPVVADRVRGVGPQRPFPAGHAFSKLIHRGCRLSIGRPVLSLGMADSVGFEEPTRTDAVDFVYPSEEGDDTKSGIDYLLEGFRSEHPEVTIELNVVSADIADLEVKTRILRQLSPDMWMQWPGQNLRPFLEADLLMDLSDVWERGGLASHFSEGARRVVSFDGTYRALPMTLHRANDLFYNPALLERAGVSPDRLSSPTEFLEALETIEQETDASGMALPMRNPWPVLQVWETVLLAEHGHDVYRAVTSGGARANSQAVRDALEWIERFIEFTPEGAVYSSLMDACYQFIDGEVALFPQGDWLSGILEAEGMHYRDGWEHAPFPGTEGYYVVVMDAFVVASDTANPAATTTFVEYAASEEAQVAFNRSKGSIPPRTDVSTEEFPPFLQSQQRAFTRSSEQPFSTAHGLAVTPTQFVELKSTIATLLVERDVDRAARQLVAVLDA